MNEGPEVVDIDDIDVPRLPGGVVQQNTEVVSRKRRNDDEDLYQENLKRRRERVHTGKTDMDVEEYITMYRDYLCLLYTSPSPRDQRGSRMPSSA